MRYTKEEQREYVRQKTIDRNDRLNAKYINDARSFIILVKNLVEEGYVSDARDIHGHDHAYRMIHKLEFTIDLGNEWSHNIQTKTLAEWAAQADRYMFAKDADDKAYDPRMPLYKILQGLHIYGGDTKSIEARDALLHFTTIYRNLSKFYCMDDDIDDNGDIARVTSGLRDRLSDKTPFGKVA